MGSDYKEHKTNTISMTISKTPKLSIVMPFFNQKDMVADMIESILANDFQDWELIAVDDGSEKNALKAYEYMEKIQESDLFHAPFRPKEHKHAEISV